VIKQRGLPARRKVNADPHPSLDEAVAVSRFWRSVDVREDDQCWPWKGDQDGKGYGIFTYRGVRRPAHELARSFSVGELRPHGFDTCHSCDVPLCCNPMHLRFGTRQENVNDMWERGRGLRGDAHPDVKVSDHLVREIRERRALGARQADLAAEYGVSAAYVSEIVNGLVRQDAGGPITGRSKRTKRTPRSKRGKAA
jgi:hypothetical protein